MKSTQPQVAMMVGVLLLALPSAGFASTCEISGTIGMAPVFESSCAVIWVPVPVGKAVAGVKWYNNDQTVVFPTVMVVTGTADVPPDPQDAFVVATFVQGPSLGWGEVYFDQPYACGGEGLYCLFTLPADSEYTSEGIGGGAGFGYTSDSCGHRGWLGDGAGVWMTIAGPAKLAIDPILVDVAPGMAMLRSFMPGSGEVLESPYLVGARPNPFNPQTTIEFSLPQAMNVELVIYDVRGKLLRRIVSGHHEAGFHAVTWAGDDATGRRVASGVYLVQLRTGMLVQSRQVLLVK